MVKKEKNKKRNSFCGFSLLSLSREQFKLEILYWRWLVKCKIYDFYLKS